MTENLTVGLGAVDGPLRGRGWQFWRGADVVSSFGLLTLWAVILIAPASLQAVSVDVEAVESKEQTTPFRIQGAYTHRFETDIDDGGEFSVDGYRVGVGAELDFTDRLSWDNYVPYEYNFYDFSGRTPFVWDDVHAFGLVSVMKYRFDGWQLYGGGMFRFHAEDDADFGDALIAGGLLGFNHAPSPNLIWGLGVAALSQIEDDMSFVPIPTLQWRFADQWRLSAGISDVASRSGVGTELTWHITPQWAVAAGGQFQRSRFRLDDKGANRDGVAEDRSAPAYVRVIWQPIPGVEVSGVGGVAVAGRLRVENKNGKKRAQEDYDPAPIAGLRVALSF